MPDTEERLEFAVFNGHRIATAVLHVPGQAVVVFCHGFKGTRAGPSRLFVRAARLLATRGISSVRFDQYGSGDSEGEFIDSSFDDWIETTRTICEHYVASGWRVALFGQSMGAAAAIAVSSELPALGALVGWSPGPNIDRFIPSPTGIVEEDGQLVRDAYWSEAHAAGIDDRLARVGCPAYIVLGTADHLVDERNRRALIDRAQPQHRIDVIDGLTHSAWSAQQAGMIIDTSCDFLAAQFRAAT